MTATDAKGEMAIRVLDLPKELLVLVVQYVDKEDRCSLRRTCKAMCEVVDHPTIWKNLTVHLARLKSYSKPFWRTLKTRNLAKVSLAGISNLSKPKLEIFLETCSHLRCLHVSCNIFEQLEALSNLYCQNFEEVYIDMYDCISNPPGSCMETLHSLPWIKKLHLKAIENDREFALVCSHISGLEGVEELGMRFTNSHSHNFLGGGTLSSLLQTLPDLQHLQLHGMKMVLNSSDGPTGGLHPINNVLLHHCMAKKASNPQTFYRDLRSLRQLRSLSLTLPTEACKTLMDTITDNLPLCTKLTILVIGLPFKPFFEFDSLPPFLESFSLRWALGGMINYSKGIVTRFPEGMRTTLKYLNFPQVRLSVADLNLLCTEFVQLEFLSCSLGDLDRQNHISSEARLGDALVDLSALPKLRRVRLWYSLAEKYSTYADLLHKASDQRIAVDFTGTTTS